MKTISEKEVALKAVEKDGMNLRIVSEELQNDKEVVLAAMGNNKNAFQFASTELQEDEELSSLVEKNDAYYFNIVNPDTGRKFDIPLLSPIDPDYYSSYVYAMKIRSASPNTFERMMSWD